MQPAPAGLGVFWQALEVPGLARNLAYPRGTLISSGERVGVGFISLESLDAHVKTTISHTLTDLSHQAQDPPGDKKQQILRNSLTRAFCSPFDPGILAANVFSLKMATSSSKLTPPPRQSRSQALDDLIMGVSWVFTLAGEFHALALLVLFQRVY